MHPGKVPVPTGSHPLLTPRGQRPVSPVSQVQGLEKELPATHFFRNSDATSSRAVSAPRKAREPRYMRATGTSFMLVAMRRPWKEREGPSMSTPPATLPGRGTEGVWGPPRGQTQPALCLAQTLISPGRREAPAAFAPAGRVTGPAGEASAQRRAPRGFLLDFSEFGWRSRGDWFSAVPAVCTAGPSVWGATRREPSPKWVVPLTQHIPSFQYSEVLPPPPRLSAPPVAPTCWGGDLPRSGRRKSETSLWQNPNVQAAVRNQRWQGPSCSA